VQQSFVKFALINELFAAGKWKRGALRLLTWNCIESQGQKERRDEGASKPGHSQARFGAAFLK